MIERENMEQADDEELTEVPTESFPENKLGQIQKIVSFDVSLKN